MEPLQSVWENKKELRKEIEQVEAPRVKATAVAQEIQNQQLVDNMSKTLTMRDRLKLCSAAQLNFLGINMLENEVTAIQVQKEEIVRENAQRERMEERKAKEKTQRKRAKERLQESGGENAYFQASKEQLLAGRAQYLRWQKGEEQPPQTLTEEQINGHEFDRDIETGAMTVNIETLLAEKNAALAYIKANQDKKMSPEESIVFRENKKVFELLDQTIESWYLANGIDFKNGKTVSRRKQEAAKAEFALQLERYQEGMANLGNAIGYATIAQIHKTQYYKETYEEFRNTTKNSGEKVEESAEGMSRLEAMALEKKDGQRLAFENRFEINPLTQHDVVKIRDMIRNNEKKYHQNKKLVDQIYRDFLANAVKVAEMSDEQKTISMFVINTRSSKAMDEAYRVVREELGRQMNSYSWSMKEQMNALQYLLQGKATNAFSADIYLHEHYGITTTQYLDAHRTAEEIEQLRGQGLTDEDIRVRLEAEHSRRQFHRSKVDEVDERIAYWEAELERRKQQAGDAPDPFLEDLEFTMTSMRRKRDVGDQDKYELTANNIMTIMTNLASEESISRFHKKQSMFHSLMGELSDNCLDERCILERKTVDKDTGEETVTRRARFSADVLNRDIVTLASSLFHEGALGIEAYIHGLENIGILARAQNARIEEEQKLWEKHAIHAKTPEAAVKKMVERALMKRTIDAAAEEIAMIEQKASEIQNYVQESGKEELLKNPPAHMTIEDAYTLMMTVSPLHENLQGLNAHLQTVMKQNYFVRLPLELQQRYQEIYPAINSYFVLSREAVKNYGILLKGTEQAQYPSFEERTQQATQVMTNLLQKTRQSELKQVQQKYAGANEETIDLARQFREMKYRKEKNSLKFYDAMQASDEIVKSRDMRIKQDIITGYRTNAAGDPLDAQEAAKKEKDERMLKAYYGKDNELTKEVMQSLWQEMLDLRLTADMFTEQYILAHPIEMHAFSRKVLVIDNWRKDHKAAYEALDEKLRDKVKRILEEANSLSLIVPITLQVAGVDPNSLDIYTEGHPTVDLLSQLRTKISENLAQIERIQNEA